MMTKIEKKISEYIKYYCPNFPLKGVKIDESLIKDQVQMIIYYCYGKGENHKEAKIFTWIGKKDLEKEENLKRIALFFIIDMLVGMEKVKIPEKFIWELISFLKITGEYKEIFDK